MTLKLRNRTYSLRIRVPARYRHLNRSSHVWRSLRTDSLEQAKAREQEVRARLMAQWAAGIDGTQERLTDYFRQVSDLAAARGYVYQTSAELAAGPLDQVLRRIEAAGRNATKETTDALLGGLEPPKAEGPKVMLSQLVATIEALEDVQERHENKGDGEMKDWRVHRERAVRYLMEAIAERDGSDGDKPVLEITPEDAWTFRDWWKKKIRRDGLKAGSANKDISYISQMIVDYAASLKDRTPPRPFAGVQVKAPADEEDGSRIELPPEWIREVLYKPHPTLAADIALVDADGQPKIGRALKSAQVLREAYAIAVVETETGCRQKEVHDLPAKDIRLNHPIPHFRIRYQKAEVDKEGRRVGGRMAKNRFSVRLVPLVGRALEVMREYADGFPIHRGTRNYSANINNWIRRHKLFPEPPEPDQKYTMSGGRHSFESRMKAYEIHSDDRGEMMGHSVKSARNRELYGKRMPPEVRMKIARLISIGDYYSEDEKRALHDDLKQLWKRWR